MAAEWSRIVFLGPSLPLDQAKAILPDAEFRPPIKRDDLTAIPACFIVGIIDGLLAKSLAISPGEIRTRSTTVCTPTTRTASSTVCSLA